MATFATYRDGAGAIEARIKKAVGLFYVERQRLPAAIIVNPTELDVAQAAVKALALSTVVKANGGCLVPEVWLGIPQEVVLR